MDNNITWILLSILTFLLAYIYLMYKKTCNYWKERRVVFPIYDCLTKLGVLQILKKKPLHEGWVTLYNSYPKDKFIGVLTFGKPAILMRDPIIIEKMLVKDFHHFVDHDFPKVDKTSLFNLGLFNLTGNEWRCYRSKMSPTFTTGKLKTMFEEMVPCGDALVENLEKAQDNYDIKDDIMSYAMDVSASVIFGIELKNKKLRSEYKHNSMNVFKLSIRKGLRLIFISIFPNLGAKLGWKFVEDEYENFFRNIIKQTLKQRSENNIQRHDYVQLLIKLKEKGYLDVKNKDPDDDYLKTDHITTTENFEVTDELLTAQAFQFLTAGFEPIYNTMVFFLLEISQNQVIQEKLRNEIKEIKAKHGGYNYIALKEIKYLDQCIHETLRKYPILSFLMRHCVKDYPVNEYFTIEKGTQIIISLMALHNDPANFHNPEKFDPERFNADSAVTNFTYLPFGGGPRICIGMRFAMMEMKFGIVNILENYSITLGDKMKFPVDFNPHSFFLSPIKSYLNFIKIPG